MKLNQISDNPGARKARMRVGRGEGSGKGKTCGHGTKGQKARSGVAIKGFEGGQMPIYRRLPKRGFTNIFRTEKSIINLGLLQKFIDEKKIDASKPINAEVLEASRLIRSADLPLRLLGNGELKSKVTLEVNYATATAKAAVEKIGGTVTVK